MSTFPGSLLPPHLVARVHRITGTRVLQDSAPFVLYWLRTAQRAHENPALDVAVAVGNALGTPVLVYHALSERYPWASDRHHRFILEGARDVAAEMAGRGIPHVFHLEREGHRGPHLVTLARQAALVVTEDLPVAFLEGWTGQLAEAAPHTPVWAVDTACLVPARTVSPGAVERAFRFRSATAARRREALSAGAWPEVVPEVEPRLPPLPFRPVELARADLDLLVAACAIDHTVAPVPHTPGGSRAGYARWEAFREGRLRLYHRTRNDPLRDGVSRMSAYLHYGMVSPFRIAREAHQVGGEGADKYLDELLVWRELAHAFCLHHPERDTVAALPSWARATLEAHEADPRQSIPSREALERGRTGDPLWDAAQDSLRIHGELHNNVRMTWGKGLLGWTRTASEALERLIDLNHRYALDGRDPSSYGGILWCLGQFDRPFTPERAVLGTVRSRSTSEHARRLDVARYAARTARPAHPGAPRVAVVGGGMSGLVCARTLADHGLRVSVLDKGRRPGGRLSTREDRERPAVRWDHGAQFFTARDPRFRRAVEGWEEEGVVIPWWGRVVRWTTGGVEPARKVVRRVGLPGMQALPLHLARDLDVRPGVRVSGIVQGEGGWWLQEENGHPLGPWDVVVVAVPAPQAVPLLAGSPTLAEAAAAVEMAPCWAGMLALDPAPDPGWDAAFVEHPVLTWVARDGSKPGRGDADTWVLHASPVWSALHLEAEPEWVAGELARAFREVVPGAAGIPDPVVHRWRYALPPAPRPEPCLWDRERGIGACGDWCAGPRVEGAFLSGAALAGRILAPESPGGRAGEGSGGAGEDGGPLPEVDPQTDLFS